MRLTDLSEGGCFVSTAAEFPRGMRMTLVAVVAGDEVTLSGSVKNQAEKNQAVSLARRTPGVTEVKDALQINP